MAATALVRDADLPLLARLVDVTREYGLLGFTSFGGPAVHIQILKKRFVPKWVDEQTFADLFALGNSLPGPGSTQLAFSIALVRHGLVPALYAFLLWSLPATIGMLALAVGARQIPASLPPIALSLLSGLNAAAVGLIAVSALKLSRVTGHDQVTKGVLFLSAAISTCYTAPWLIPVVTVSGGLMTLAFDTVRRSSISDRLRRRRTAARRTSADEPVELARLPVVATEAEIEIAKPSPALSTRSTSSTMPVHRLPTPPPESERPSSLRQRRQADPSSAPAAPPPMSPIAYNARVGQALLWAGSFFAMFIAILVARGALDKPPRALELYAGMTLSGTIIFGGGPVVTPALQSVTVFPGWVSNQDFLLGFAILQAFPGPNFAFSSFLGYLSLPSAPVLGSFLAWLGIFAPGIMLKLAVLPIYRAFRENERVRSLLRGLNASATGLIWSAVYRLWVVGALRPEGRVASLDFTGWFVVVAAAAFLAGDWVGAPPWACIMGGAVGGLVFQGVVQPTYT